MKFIRWFLGKIILFLDSAFVPHSIERSEAEQKKLNDKTKSFALYQFETCPFCVKVRRAIKRMNLNIELRDIKKVPAYADELVKNGGQLQAPCLKISNPDGSVRWLYESSDIIVFLEDSIKVAS